MHARGAGSGQRENSFVHPGTPGATQGWTPCGGYLWVYLCSTFLDRLLEIRGLRLLGSTSSFAAADGTYWPPRIPRRDPPVDPPGGPQGCPRGSRRGPQEIPQGIPKGIFKRTIPWWELN